MTLYEYEAKMYAYSLQQIDNERDMHVQAWINHQVTGTKKDKPLYKKFEDFFDYEKRVKEVESANGKSNEISDRDKRIARAFKKIGERR